jgi:hypothetical protein
VDSLPERSDRNVEPPPGAQWRVAVKQHTPDGEVVGLQEFAEDKAGMNEKYVEALLAATRDEYVEVTQLGRARPDDYERDPGPVMGSPLPAHASGYAVGTRQVNA